MKRVLFLLFFLLVLIVASAFGQVEKSGTKALAEFEFGGDSSARRYYKPLLRFEFQLYKRTEFFLSFSHYQVMNKKLEGLVDFWIRGGLYYQLSETTKLELSVNHMSRHITNHNTPFIFDVNDFILRSWFKVQENLCVGLGGGLYMGTRWKDYGRDNLLLVSNLNYKHILGSEFSISAEAKLINFNELLWEAELSAELSKNLDLFVKNIKHYNGYWPNPVYYFGLRLKNNQGGEAGESTDAVTKIRLKPAFYLGSEEYRGHLEEEIYYEFLHNENTRFALALNLDLPIFRGADVFGGTYRPENMNYYPVRLEYEKEFKNMLIGAYCGNQVTMPMDKADEAVTNISFGAFLRNQHHFEDLQSSVRYELLIGKNFQRTYELDARLGVNTRNKKINFGADARLLTYEDYEQESLEFFADISFLNKVHLRPFAELKSAQSTSYFSVGICFLKF